jgi:hypothetical protein
LYLSRRHYYYDYSHDMRGHNIHIRVHCASYLRAGNAILLHLKAICLIRRRAKKIKSMRHNAALLDSPASVWNYLLCQLFVYIHKSTYTNIPRRSMAYLSPKNEWVRAINYVYTAPPERILFLRRFNQSERRCCVRENEQQRPVNELNAECMQEEPSRAINEDGWTNIKILWAKNFQLK